MATLLSIVQAVTGELGLTVPTVAAASTDPQIVQIIALLNREGRELQQDWEWTQLQTEFIVNAGAPTVTTGNTTSNSAVITNIPDTSAIAAGRFMCSGNGVPVAARVSSVDSSTQVTLSMRATATAIGVTLSFTQDSYELPTDFDRFIDQTGWDRTNRWSLLGPDSPQIDQWHRSGIVTTGPRRHFRQIGTSYAYRLWPPPSSSDTPFAIVFEYISKNWCASSGGTGQSVWSADTDVPLLDENMFILGGKWRFLQAKGLEYAPHQREYLDYVDRCKAKDGGASILRMSSHSYDGMNPAFVPDGNWPGPVGPNTS